MKLATVVPTKGATGAFAARKVVEWIAECGCHEMEVIIKSDQEPAIRYLVDDVLKHRTGAKTLIEDSRSGAQVATALSNVRCKHAKASYAVSKVSWTSGIW